MVVHSTRGRRGFFLDPPSNPPSNHKIDAWQKRARGPSRGITRSFFHIENPPFILGFVIFIFFTSKVNFHIFHSQVKIIRGEVACTIVLLEKSFGETSCKTPRLAWSRGCVSERFLIRIGGSREGYWRIKRKEEITESKGTKSPLSSALLLGTSR